MEGKIIRVRLAVANIQQRTITFLKKIRKLKYSTESLSKLISGHRGINITQFHLNAQPQGRHCDPRSQNYSKRLDSHAVHVLDSEHNRDRSRDRDYQD